MLGKAFLAGHYKYMSIFGIILAGGEGTRFGCVDKAALRLKNTPLVAHVFTHLDSQVDEIALVGDTNAALPPNLIQLSDGINPPIGPLGGIYAGAKWANDVASDTAHSWLLTAPVDGPLFPIDFVAHAEPFMATRTPIIARYGEDFYPVCGLWPLEMALNIPALLEKQFGYALRPMLKHLEAQEIDFEQFYSHNPFTNANKIADLLALYGQMGR